MFPSKNKINSNDNIDMDKHIIINSQNNIQDIIIYDFMDNLENYLPDEIFKIANTVSQIEMDIFIDEDVNSSSEDNHEAIVDSVHTSDDEISEHGSIKEYNYETIEEENHELIEVKNCISENSINYSKNMDIELNNTMSRDDSCNINKDIFFHCFDEEISINNAIACNKLESSSENNFNEIVTSYVFENENLKREDIYPFEEIYDYDKNKTSLTNKFKLIFESAIMLLGDFNLYD